MPQIQHRKQSDNGKGENMAIRTPKGMRMHIGLFGRRNSGKSSLLNAITRQRVSLVSEMAGTTTDPVEKPMELLPLGPVLFIDTAGIDDVGALGELRIERTRNVFKRTDMAVIVATSDIWSDFEEKLIAEFSQRHTPIIVVFNKIDLAEPPKAFCEKLIARKICVVKTAALTGEGILDFRQALIDSAPPEYLLDPIIISDLVPPGEVAVLVVPIDKEAPRGRLILPQVQTIRDLLDGNASCIVTKDDQLAQVLAYFRRPPCLVVTDSQAFKQVSQIIPPTIPLTGFSILFSRFKGHLPTQVEGTLAIERLVSGDRILVAEQCTHHPIEDDIGRVKIPRWLREFTGADLTFVHVQGHDFPDDVTPYRLVIHCGACTANRQEILSRIAQCRSQGVPITNYGLTIAYSLGILGRALEPFPEAYNLYRSWRKYDYRRVT